MNKFVLKIKEVKILIAYNLRKYSIFVKYIRRIYSFTIFVKSFKKIRKFFNKFQLKFKTYSLSAFFLLPIGFSIVILILLYSKFSSATEDELSKLLRRQKFDVIVKKFKFNTNEANSLLIYLYSMEVMERYSEIVKEIPRYIDKYSFSSEQRAFLNYLLSKIYFAYNDYKNAFAFSSKYKDYPFNMAIELVKINFISSLKLKAVAIKSADYAFSLIKRSNKLDLELIKVLTDYFLKNNRNKAIFLLKALLSSKKKNYVEYALSKVAYLEKNSEHGLLIRFLEGYYFTGRSNEGLLLLKKYRPNINRYSYKERKLFVFYVKFMYALKKYNQLENILSSQSNKSTPYFYLGWYYKRRGKFTKALKIFNNIYFSKGHGRDLKQDRMNSLYNIAYIYKVQKNYKEFYNSAERFIKEFSFSTILDKEIYKTSLDFIYNSDFYKAYQLLKLLTKYEQRLNGDKYLYFISYCLRKLGRITEADEFLKKIYIFYPESYFVFRAKELLSNNKDIERIKDKKKLIESIISEKSHYEARKLLSEHFEILDQKTVHILRNKYKAKKIASLQASSKAFNYFSGLREKLYKRGKYLLINGFFREGEIYLRTLIRTFSKKESIYASTLYHLIELSEDCGDYYIASLFAGQLMRLMKMRVDPYLLPDYLLKHIYPMPYYSLVEKYIKKNPYNVSSIKPALIYGLMKTESAFNTYAVSRSGARGLLQLMPSTAFWIIKKKSLDIPKKKYALFVPEYNIRISLSYVYDLKKRFDDIDYYYISAYNGGGGRMAKWKQRFSKLKDELFVETINYTESKNFYYKVKKYKYIYETY